MGGNKEDRPDTRATEIPSHFRSLTFSGRCSHSNFG